MITTIYLADLIERESEKQETFRGTLQEVKQRLIELENGYCEDKEKPTLLLEGAMILAVNEATDFFYFANTAFPDIIEDTDDYPKGFRVTGVNTAEVGKHRYSWMSPNEPGGICGWVKRK